MTIETICKRSILTYSACKEEKSLHKIHTGAIYSPSTYNIYNDVEFLVSVKFVTCPFLIKHFSLFVVICVVRLKEIINLSVSSNISKEQKM